MCLLRIQFCLLGAAAYQYSLPNGYDCNIILLIKKFHIGPVTGPRSAVLARPRANTADLEPVTGPIRNYLINDNFIN